MAHGSALVKGLRGKDRSINMMNIMITKPNRRFVLRRNASLSQPMRNREVGDDLSILEVSSRVGV
jgi:hypothetical protein